MLECYMPLSISAGMLVDLISYSSYLDEHSCYEYRGPGMFGRVYFVWILWILSSFFPTSSSSSLIWDGGMILMFH